MRLRKLKVYPLQKKSDIRNRMNRLLRAFMYEVWQAAFAQSFTRGWLEMKGVGTSTDRPTPGSRVLLETNSPSAGREIRCLVCNLQSHYRVHMTTTMVPIPKQIYPVHITSYFGNIHFSTIFQFTYYFPRASSTQGSDWHSVGTSHDSRVCYMPCQSHPLCFGKIFGVFDYAHLFSLAPGGLNRKGNSILLSSVINL